MRVSAIACGLLACFVSQVAATALTYKLHANERACFYAKTEKENEKIAFYFAVQSGGSFDVDYVVTGPGNKIILDGAKERQGDFVFTAQQLGDYEFCFNNDMSTFAEKFVDFEIAVENEVRAQLPAKQGASREQHTTLEETVFKLSGQLSTISRGQKYFRTRENRNFSTVRSTEGRIINFSMIHEITKNTEPRTEGDTLTRYITTTTTSLEVDRDLSMPSSSRHNSKHAKKPKKQPAEKWYIIKDILQERKRGADIEYLVDWEDDPDTGERYRPTWTPSIDVTSKAIFDWRKKLDTLYREDHTTHPEESGAQNEDAFTHTPAVEPLDSSQPIQSPRKRNRPQTSQSDDSQLWNSEDNLNPPKRGRLLSEAPSTLSSDSFAHTDAASDVLYNNSTFFISSSNGAPASNSSPLAGIENERAAEQIIACSDTQNARSQNTQLAQVVAPLPDISASQIGLSCSSAEDPVIPDTVRRKPSRKQRLNAGPTSSGSSRPDDSDAGISSRSLNRSSATPQRDEDEDEHSEPDSFQTCFERRSPPTLSSPYNSQDGGRRSQPIDPPFTMDTSSDEPLSAIEELMRIQEAALQGTLTEGGLTSPTTVLGQHHEYDPAITDAADQAFSASMHIHSQPPISSDWMVEPVASSTEMPALSSVPSGPAIEAPVDDAPRTASMGDIFPSNLMSPESADQLPTTISPSDISRSIEPDLSLSGLQHDDQPLGLLPEDDTTAGGKSTVTSPDIEETYLSAPPAAVDQNEYLVTVSFPANIRPLYLSTMTAYKREIEHFNLALQSDEGLPDKATVEAVGRLFDQLRNICDMPVTLDGPSIDALSAVDLKKHAMGTNSKFFFVGRFLERLQTSHKKILIVVRDINIVGYLEAVVGTGNMSYSLKGLHELESREEHSLLVVLVYSEQPLVDDLSDFDVVIGFDNGILQTDILSRWAEMSGKKPMLIRLMTTCSIEHLELMMPAELEGLERHNALLIALFQARALVANDEQGEMIDNFASLFANQAIDPDPGFGWEPELIPSNVLDFYSSTPSHNQIPPSAEELSTRKRKADDGSQQSVKRLRVSRSPEQIPGDIDAAVHSHLNPDPSRVHVQTTQGYLDSLSTKISELEHQLEEKTTLEINLRKHITNLAKRVKSHDKTINLIQERHMAALRERSQFESLRDDAQQNEGKAWEETHVWQDKAKTLEEELKKKSAILEEALINAGTVATETFKEKTAELEKALGKIAELEKKLESRDGELGYARDAYQTANHANSELTRENRELKEQVELLRKSAVGSLAQVQKVNAGEQVKEMQRQITETQAISKDREKELARIEKELRALKNGRRETRQQSVPRSPRLGMMSPRTGRAAGGSASRGTSPTPHESTGSTPAAGLQFFNTPAN
ncbi:putative membrane protein, partial [Colletotrichum shisoi]